MTHSGDPPDLPHDRRSELLAVLAIVAMTAVWGSTFVIIKDAIEQLAIGSFLAIRFAIATAVLLILRPGAIGRLDRSAWRAALILGVLYGVGQVLQTWGLRFTSPSVSGFVTGMYVVFTPLIAAALVRQRVALRAWLAVVIALAGIAVLSLHGFALGSGELLTLAAAFVYGGHIVATGEWSPGRDPIGLVTVQLGTVALVGVAAMPFDGRIELPSGGQEWFAVIYTAVFASSLVLLLQTWAQARISPTRAAVTMMLEPVFAAGFAVALGVDTLTLRMVIGGVMVLAAMYLVELGPRKGAEGSLPHAGPP